MVFNREGGPDHAAAGPRRALPLPPAFQDAIESGQILLRDGSTAAVRRSEPSDGPGLTVFFAGLSSESRRHHAFAAHPPPAALVQSFCDNSDPRRQQTLVVTRLDDGRSRIVAAGSYVGREDDVAELVVAVEDRMQGKGLGTAIVERLTLLALQNGFGRVRAAVTSGNRRALEVFRDCGFEVRVARDGGCADIELAGEPGPETAAQAERRDRIATVTSLAPFAAPAAVAVIGASRRPDGIGHRVLRALIEAGFRGTISAVNPSRATILGVETCASVRELSVPPDLAIVAVNHSRVPAVVDDCAARGVKAIVVITAGYAESGPEGRARQDALVAQVRGHGLRMVGPNCLGILNTDPAVRLNASFSPTWPLPGSVAMLSQSGALGLALLSFASQLGLGVSSFFSVGNKADVSGNDLLQFWDEDARTGVVLLYLESFGNPRRFARIARRLASRKPVVALKAGRREAGRRAAGSHTAALAGSDIAVEALFRQSGVLRVDTLEELFDVAACLDTQPLPEGPRVGIITNAGGPGILCADACEGHGLTVPELPARLQSELASALPSLASVRNPVDMVASAGAADYRLVIDRMIASRDVDAIIVIHTPVMSRDLAPMLDAVREAVAAGRGREAAAKPVLVCVLAPDAPRGFIAAGGERVPLYTFPERAARALAAARDYAEWRRRPASPVPDLSGVHSSVARVLCRRILSERGEGWLAGPEARAVLQAFGLPVAASGFARTADEAADAARRLGFPVAVKLSSRTILHKTDIGAVRLNLANDQEVRAAFDAIAAMVDARGEKPAMEGVEVQPMLRGLEVFVGMAEDRTFGPLLAFGLGGVNVEVIRDIAFGVTPLTEADARDLIRSIRGYPLLCGYRGRPAADLAALEDIVLRVARLAEELPEVVELDLNPVFAGDRGAGCVVADARIRVAPPRAGQPQRFITRA
jgi:acyl-CoA synthetase (NDP forming)/GNAT superfamily N-acetyltransferase